MSAPGLVIAAPSSGSGKTVFTLGLVRLWARQGVAVAAAKVGPDYIDPAFHAAAGGSACVNLDPWAMRPPTLAALAGTLAADAGMVVCEGVMGLFDGATVDSGSTADLAALTGWPVVLVVDVRAQAASAAAVVRGFVGHRPGLAFAGVVFNRTGSDRHRDVLREACAAAVPDVPILGFLPRTDTLALPERHLGLVQAAEHPALDRFLDAAADLVGAHVDADALRLRARIARTPPASQGSTLSSHGIPPLGQRVAIADDAAFAFSYAHLRSGWRAAGAELLPFSPLADDAPPDDCDAVYLPGGYPELHAGRLAANRRFSDGLRRAAARGATVFGECGGYMVLGEGLIDAAGERHRMAGLLPLETSFAERRLHLGYRQAALAAPCPLGPVGAPFRGHEFHYATIVREPQATPLFRCRDATGRMLGPTGAVNGTVFGSFVHLIDSDDPAG